MGGYGSGKWRIVTRRLVEDCLVLQISHLKYDISYVCKTKRSWDSVISWWDNRTDENVANIGYEIFLEEGIVFVRLMYQTDSISTGEKDYLDYRIRLETTAPHFGGFRFWFNCPLKYDNKPCDRRMAKLYLPEGSSFFGCRVCHDLTYLSCVESHRWDSLFKSIGIDPKLEKQYRKQIEDVELRVSRLLNNVI